MGTEAPAAEQRAEEFRFLSRMARKQTPDRQEDPAEFLLDTARLRICLGRAAGLLEDTVSSGLCLLKVDRFWTGAGPEGQLRAMEHLGNT